MHSTPAYLTALFIAVLSSTTRADTLVGRVVDSNGQPVANVDIDFKNQGSGGDPTPSGDHTAVDGTFSVTVPLGLYDVMFFPPAPPASTALYHEIENVSVIGVKNLGDVVIPAGFALTGRALGPGGVPIVGMDLDVRDLLTGDIVEMNYDITDASGNFAVAVPTGPFEIVFDGSSVVGQTWVWQGFEFDLTGNFAMGVIEFEPGYALTGRVVNSSGIGVANADIDLYDAGGDFVYTSSDNTNALGNFSVVSPAGFVDVEICPLFTSPVAGIGLFGVAVQGATNVGTLLAPPAVTLSGTVTDFTGAPVQSGDIDLFDALTGADVYVCYDHVTPAGTYALRAPLGTYDVVFEPVDFSVPLGADVVPGVLLNSNKVLNGALPSCPFPSTYGSGSPGAGGIVPSIGSSGGAPRDKNGDFALTVTNTVGGTFGYFVIGFGAASFPFGSGTGLIDPFGPLLYYLFVTDGAAGVPGAGTGSLPLPVKSNYVGIHPNVQAIVIDLSTVDFFALSDGLALTFCQ